MMTDKRWQTVKKVVEVIKEPMLAFLSAILIICFVVSHTHVPTKSMVPTILPGNHLIVNRVPYYYRDPIQGEIIVFNFEGQYLIKRVIGVPGDTINIIDDKIYLNGEKLDESSYLEEGMKTYLFAGSPIQFPYTVPDNSYFVLGDNRINSRDSRVFGAISREDIIAKAGIRIFPLDQIGYVR